MKTFQFIEFKKNQMPCIKTLHSNMLLPFSVMPSVSEVQILNPKQKRTRQERPTQIHHSDEESETDQSDIIVHFPRKYVVPQRMNDTYGGRIWPSNPPMSDLTSSRRLSSVPVSPPVNESDVMSSQSRDQSAADSSMSYKIEVCKTYEDHRQLMLPLRDALVVFVFLQTDMEIGL